MSKYNFEIIATTGEYGEGFTTSRREFIASDLKTITLHLESFLRGLEYTNLLALTASTMATRESTNLTDPAPSLSKPTT